MVGQINTDVGGKADAFHEAGAFHQRRRRKLDEGHDVMSIRLRRYPANFPTPREAAQVPLPESRE